MPSDTIVREGRAGRARLRAPGPGRRRRPAGRHRRRRGDPAGRRGRGGRPTSAPGMTAARHPARAATPPTRRRRAEPRAAAARWALGSLVIVAVWVVVWSFTAGPRHPRPARSSTHTDLHEQPHRVPRRRCSPAATPTRSSQLTYSIADGFAQRLRLAPADDLDARLPAAGAADRLARRHRARRPGSPTPSPAGGSPLLVGALVPRLRLPRLLDGLDRPADRHRSSRSRSRC